MSHHSILAIIPARAGSKRLPNKNKLEFCGKPLVEWSVDEAKKVTSISEIIVTTNDEDILRIAHEKGVRAYRRSEKLSSDEATTVDVVLDVLSESKKTYDFIILLQPTSPLRRKSDIEGALKLLVEKKAKSVISVSEADHSPLWSNTLPNDNSMMGFIDKEILNKRSQDLPKYYRINGAIYVIAVNEFVKHKKFYLESDSYAFLMDKYRSVDIDDEFDFECAKSICNKLNVN